jgi:hypothetical protein
MTTIDYDAPRRSTDEPEEDNAEELQSRRPPQSPAADLDQPDAVEGFALPAEELTGEEPTMSVVTPMLADEFRCPRCFLVCHRSQRVAGPAGLDVCGECA